MRERKRFRVDAGFLDWSVKEQGEEEDTAETNLKKFQLFGSDPKGLMHWMQSLARESIPHLL